MGGRINRNEDIIRKQEALAVRLLERVNKDEITIDIQLDVFEKVGRWVAIRNKVEDQEETRIDVFKRRIHGEEGEVDFGKEYPRSRYPKGYKPRQPRLEALRNRVSGKDDGHTDGDKPDTGGKASAAA